jgi:hypothetical protein
MKQNTQHIISITIGIVLSVLLLPNSMAQDYYRNNDARTGHSVQWTHENYSSPNDNYQLRKRARVTYQRSMNRCKREHGYDRVACQNEAHQQYEHDLQYIRRH